MPIVKIRKSGNSTVIVIPAQMVKEKNIRPGEEVEFLLFKREGIKSFFGRGKHLKKLNSQKMKDMLRKEW